jgi:hypothetical protein
MLTLSFLQAALRRCKQVRLPHRHLGAAQPAAPAQQDASGRHVRSLLCLGHINIPYVQLTAINSVHQPGTA